MSVLMENKLSRVSANPAPSKAAAPNSLQLLQNTTVDINAARLPARRAPISATGLRLTLKWLDAAIAGLLSWYFLTLSGVGLLDATVYQILPFV